MGKEVNLLHKYPKTNRNLDERSNMVTDEVRAISRQFDKEYFDGDRLYGYGGYKYDPKYWKDTVKEFMYYYNLPKTSRILDVGCARGYMLFEFKKLYPMLKVRGIDISKYAIETCKPEMKRVLSVGSADDLPYPDNRFDLVISINTVHNLPRDRCIMALSEIQRVSGNHSFITVDAWRTEEERVRMEKWNLTALTYMHVDEWVELFKEAGYTGDYYWFMP